MNKTFHFDFQNLNSFFCFKQPKKGGTIKALLITIISFFVCEYFLLVPLTFRSPAFLVLLAFFIFLFFLLRALLNQSLDSIGKKGFFISPLIVVFVFGGVLMSSEIFHASSYQKQLNMNKEADFYKDNEKVNYQSIPVVDKDSAERLGDRKMGEIVEYVSQFEVDDEYSQINYQDKPYRVTTLSYSGFVKWFTNHKNGLPAYITVDMVTQESKVVRLEKAMKYSRSDLFFRNIDRYLWMKYPTLMFEELSFEIDEDGIPYWIAPVYEYKIGLYGGEDIVGAVLVNAVDGKCQYYEKADIPQWVDRIYSSDLVLTQLNNWGTYINGFINAKLSQKGVLKSTDGYNYLALNDDVYLYTGLTSISQDESNVGFALINLRTKEAKFYAISGAEEYSAMSSAEGKVQNLGYKATFPILINAGGEPTYFMSLKDSAGLVKQYAFVNVEKYTVVATGDSVADAEKAYYRLLKDNGIQISNSQETNTMTEGKINQLNSAVVNGNTYYYFTIENNNTVYIASITLDSRLPLMKIGDDIKFEYDPNSISVENINSIEFK